MNCFTSFRSFRPTFLLLTILPVAAGCACSGRDQAAEARSLGDTIGTVKRLVVVARPAVPYHVVAIASPGMVTGTVQFTGTPKGDTLIQVPADQNGCGTPLVVKRLERRNGFVANAVVWLTDVREGRALPLARRFDLENDNCAWLPTVQGVLAGGALDVENSDPLVERAYATDISTGDTVAVAPFTDAGQVIPYDQMLRTPGVYEFTVESRPMSRAWVAVFDHPYFAVTGGDGRFSFDGVPPGTHHVRAWHPMLGVTEETVTVTPGQQATAVLRW